MDTMNKVPKLDEHTLQKLVSDYIDAEQRMSGHVARRSTVEGSKPIMFEIYDTLEEYNQYNQLVTEYNASVESWNSLHQLLESEQVLAAKALMDILPANAWFRSTWEDKPIWVGYNTSSWGNRPRQLNISYTKPTKALKHVNYE